MQRKKISNIKNQKAKNKMQKGKNSPQSHEEHKGAWLFAMLFNREMSI